MDAGALDKRVAFQRRAFINERERGDYAPFLTVWAAYRRTTGAQKVEGGRPTDVEEATLIIRDSAAAREITGGDRVTVQGRDFAIQSVGLPNRLTGMISIDISSTLGD